MKKKVIILISVLTIFNLIYISFLILNKGEESEKNMRISVILQTEEGNIESNTFPIEPEYIFDKVMCENTKDEVHANFNEQTSKLDLRLQSKK